MRTVFIGASALSLMTSRLLSKRGHEVVIIETDKEKIDSLKETLDCGFINGDGGKPAILKEADPGNTDLLFCLTGNDQTNILASLVGRTLGFKRIVTKIDDPELEHVCIELGLEHTIIPARTIGHHLSDLVDGQDPLELSTIIRDEARIYSFVLKEEITLLSELNLPKACRVICVYRSNKMLIPTDETSLQLDDEIVVIVHRDQLAALKERY